MSIKSLFSPSKIKSFLNCKYILVNDFYKDEKDLKKKKISKTNELRFKKGFDHEDKYFALLKKKYKKTINLRDPKKKNEERFKETIDAMKKGYDVIRSGFFIDEDWIGETDFLIKTDKKKSKLGDYSYEIYDTKNSNKVRDDHVIQVGVYCVMLEKIQGVLPEKFYIVLKDHHIEPIKLSNVYNYVLFNKDRFQNYIENDLDNTKPEKCGYCNICDWIEECEKIWIKEDHLNQLGNINKVQIKKLNEVGIKTIADLSKKPQSFKVKNLNPEVFKRLNISSKLRKKFEETGKPQSHIIEENLNLEKGFNLLPEPSESDLFFDIESVQDHIVEGGLEYLFGFYYYENGKPIFKALWAHNRKQEKKNLQEFFKFTKKHFEKYPNAKIYHYAKYEITAFRKLVARHNVCDIEYDNYLRQSRFVDLLAVVKNAVLVSENSYSLKNLEIFYDFKRTGEVQKGDVSEDYYATWLETDEKKFLNEIEDYNKQDCHSTFSLRDWLLSIRPEKCNWYKPEQPSEEEKGFETALNLYRHKLANEKIKYPEIKEIAEQILGFFRRDQRSEWRMFFERKNMSHDELIEDTECIGDLTQIEKPYPEKRSLVYTYTFPEQEYKLKEKEKASLANNILINQESSYAGEIVELDQKKRIIKLKKSSKGGNLPENISIGKNRPTDVQSLESATFRYLDSIFTDSKKEYSAINDILKKSAPRIKGVKPGKPILESNEFLNEIPKAILNLDNSYIFIQGPPGTGKTFQASNVISELLKQGKRVAVSANSHKVIHNLLDQVEETCDGKDIHFAGVKKSSKDNEEQYYRGKFIQTITEEREYINLISNKKIQLFAGTKYHFSKAFYDQKIDYLFIDEAGQVSLADVIVMGTIAHNIILIGDQMQLPQPIQGDHPGESGKSVLEYLLEVQDTIPKDRGIFLNKTYRMHPKINSFISDTFYEGRLEYDPSTEKRKIDYGKAQINSDGISFIAAKHEDYSQRNEVEGEMIKKLYKELIGLKFTDTDGSTRKLTVEDILTISPFNVQVNYLKSILPADSRVGTIDKFQGQQAPITIISMTSSDSENLPRAKDFFFNRNRLNVAISRAQLSSIIIFNPSLLETSTRTVEEIYLLENFFKLMKYKKKFN